MLRLSPPHPTSSRHSLGCCDAHCSPVCTRTQNRSAARRPTRGPHTPECGRSRTDCHWWSACSHAGTHSRWDTGRSRGSSCPAACYPTRWPNSGRSTGTVGGFHMVNENAQPELCQPRDTYATLYRVPERRLLIAIRPQVAHLILEQLQRIVQLHQNYGAEYNVRNQQDHQRRGVLSAHMRWYLANWKGYNVTVNKFTV